MHPDLLPALGRLITQAARQTQVIVVTHANRLLSALEDAQASRYTSDEDSDDTALPDWQPIHLEKDLGETQIANLNESEIPRWEWLSA